MANTLIFYFGPYLLRAGGDEESNNITNKKQLTHLCPVNPSTSSLWAVPFVKGGTKWLVFIITLLSEISVNHANSVDPDQTPRFAASDLGLHCLPMSLL